MTGPVMTLSSFSTSLSIFCMLDSPVYSQKVIGIHNYLMHRAIFCMNSHEYRYICMNVGCNVR